MMKWVRMRRYRQWVASDRAAKVVVLEDTHLSIYVVTAIRKMRRWEVDVPHV